MDLGYSDENRLFQDQVEAFLSEHWPGQGRGEGATGKAKVREFRRLATEAGYLYRGIPRRYGGSQQSADGLKGQIIRECFERAKAPMEVPGNGVSMVVPTLLECGSEAQREMFIPKTLTGDYRWAQGYSEPGSGSDLASLKTRAELVGGEWIISGHKIWTSYAHDCTHMFALVRTETEVAGHGGISYLLLRMDQPGVELRRIRQISGQSEFCEVFLDQARTPSDWIVGERGQGWTVSKSTLKHERNSIGGMRTLRLYESLIRLAQSVQVNNRPAIEDPLLLDRIVAIEGHVQSQICSGYYQMTCGLQGRPAGIHPLLNKLAATQAGLEIAQIASDLIGERALTMPDESGSGQRSPSQWLNQIFGSLALSIAGGTSNIQRNVIAERGLGLPRELRDAEG